MKKITIITLALLVLAFSGCATTDQKTELNYTVLNGGKVFSKPLSSAKIFNSEKEYNSFLMARAIRTADLVRNFDFENSSLLVVYLGKRALEGYGLEIVSITEEPDRIAVYAREIKSDGKKTSQYYLSIKKTDKKADLILKRPY